MTRRRLVVAAVAGVVAIGGVWVLGGGGGRSGRAIGEAGGVADEGVVPVVRVVREVRRGTSGDEALASGALEVIDVPASDPVAVGALPPGALSGAIAVDSAPAGSVLVVGSFAAADAGRGALAGRLPTPGHTALAITLDATRAAGGWLQPGDRVNLLVPGVCADEGAAQATAAASGGEVRCRRARYLYQAVDVLAVGGVLVGSASTTELPASGPLTVVLSLPPRAAQWVATWENELTLALVPADYVARVVDPLPVVVGRLPGEELPTLLPGCADPAAPSPEGEVTPCPAELVP